jgi:hypothetical protein
MALFGQRTARGSGSPGKSETRPPHARASQCIGAIDKVALSTAPARCRSDLRSDHVRFIAVRSELPE